MLSTWPSGLIFGIRPSGDSMSGRARLGPRPLAARSPASLRVPGPASYSQTATPGYWRWPRPFAYFTRRAREGDHRGERRSHPRPERPAEAGRANPSSRGIRASGAGAHPHRGRSARDPETLATLVRGDPHLELAGVARRCWRRGGGGPPDPAGRGAPRRQHARPRRHQSSRRIRWRSPLPTSSPSPSTMTGLPSSRCCGRGLPAPDKGQAARRSCTRSIAPHWGGPTFRSTSSGSAGAPTREDDTLLGEASPGTVIRPRAVRPSCKCGSACANSMSCRFAAARHHSHGMRLGRLAGRPLIQTGSDQASRPAS